MIMKIIQKPYKNNTKPPREIGVTGNFQYVLGPVAVILGTFTTYNFYSIKNTLKNVTVYCAIINK